MRVLSAEEAAAHEAQKMALWEAMPKEIKAAIWHLSAYAEKGETWEDCCDRLEAFNWFVRRATNLDGKPFRERPEFGPTSS